MIPFSNFCQLGHSNLVSLLVLLQGSSNILQYNGFLRQWTVFATKKISLWQTSRKAWFRSLLYLFKLQNFTLLVFVSLLHLSLKNKSINPCAESVFNRKKLPFLQRRSKTWQLTPTTYHSNHVAILQLKLSGYTETNPEPIGKPSCKVCDKAVRCNRRHLLCKLYQNLQHRICF